MLPHKIQMSNLDCAWSNKIFMKMSNLNDQVEIKVLLHVIDYAYHINAKSYQDIFSTKEKMDESYQYRII